MTPGRNRLDQIDGPERIWIANGPEYVRADLYEAQLAGHRLSAKQSTENLIRAASAEATVTALHENLKLAEEVLEPFSGMAGEYFARNWSASRVVIALDNPDDPHRVTAGDFFAARAAYTTIRRTTP